MVDSLRAYLSGSKQFGFLPRLWLGGTFALLLVLGLWLALLPLATPTGGAAHAAPEMNDPHGPMRVDDEITDLSASNDGPSAVDSSTNFEAQVSAGAGISYTWDFGDGNSGSGITTTHTYTESGVYTATVTATNETDTVSATTTVYVGDAVVDVGPSTSYFPPDVTIPVDGNVIWVLRGGFHSVTEDEGRFNQPQGTDWEPFVVNFDEADLYDYHCTVHSGMVGHILVEGETEQLELHLPDVRVEEEIDQRRGAHTGEH